MDKKETLRLMLEKLEEIAALAKTLHPDGDYLSLTWGGDEGDYLHINNDYFDLDEDAKKIKAVRINGKDRYEFV